MDLFCFIDIVKGTLIKRPKVFNNKISIDTRTIIKDDIFIPICFKDGNGNMYIKEASSTSSLLLIPSSYLNNTNILEEVINNNHDIGIIEIDDGLEVLKRIAIYKRNNYKGKIICITGSNGKTSTKELLYIILSKKYKTFKSRENYNNILGICMMLLELDDSEYAIFELGMNHLGEISEMSKILKPSIGLITNIGTAHIGNLGSIENILKAKIEILDGFNDDSILFINSKDNNLNKINYKNIIRYDNLDYKIKNNKLVLIIKNKNIKLNLIGEHNIYNISSAYNIATYLKISNKEIIKSLKEYKNIRMQKITINKALIINDSYNANYESMINGIKYIDTTNFDKKVLVLGDMIELGDYEKEIHEEIGRYINNTSITKVYTYGNLSKYISNTCIKETINYNDRELLINDLKKELNNITIIYFKGSHIMNMDYIIEQLK